MGILKDLTKEYFGKKVRKEDGKKITIHGCDVIVPPDWDEGTFIDSVFTVLENRKVSEFTDKYRFRSKNMPDYTLIECKKPSLFCILKYDKIKEYLTTKKIPNETTYNSIIKFLTYFLKDVCIIDWITNYKYKNYIGLTDLEKIDALLNADDKNEFDVNDLIRFFLEDFGQKAHIDEDSFPSHPYSLNLPITRYTLLYAREMIEWWENTFSGIEKQGSARFFGYDYEDE